MAAIENFLRGSYCRTADMFHRVGRPLEHVLHRWANSGRPGSKFLYEGAGIAIYVIAYLVMFALYLGFGGVGGVGIDLPNDEDKSNDSPREKGP